MQTRTARSRLATAPVAGFPAELESLIVLANGEIGSEIARAYATIRGQVPLFDDAWDICFGRWPHPASRSVSLGQVLRPAALAVLLTVCACRATR